MLTFFTTAKPFRGHDGIIQKNALKSWTLLHRDVEVVLFGDEEGAAQTAKQLQIRHEPNVTRNEFGTKRLDTMFARAQTIARHELRCFVNCDILLLQDFCDAVHCVRSVHSQFLMVGRRWDTEITKPVDFENKDWEARLRGCVLREGRRRTPEWIDYFVFTGGIYGADLPPFVIGRVFWDNWLVWKALASRHPVVDVSSEVLAVHQNHDYGYHPQGKQGVFLGPEAGRNYQIAGGWKHLRTIADATVVLRRDGLKPNYFRHWATAKRQIRQAARIFLHGGVERVWFLFLGLTRPMRQKLGLRAQNLQRLRRRTLPLLGKHP